MMMRTMPAFALALVCVTLWDSPAPAQDEIDAGQAKITPWSGYWWPHQEGAIQRPLSKYDQLTGHRALAWERRRHPAHAGVPAWHGYCHGWAASAMLEPEPLAPRHVRRRRSDSEPEYLSVGDQKALLAVAHANDVANSYGSRFGEGDGAAQDPQDLAPEILWRLLRMYIKYQGVPLIVDLDAAEQVWNFPVYAYEVRHSPQESGFTRNAQLTLWMADNGVSPDFVGTQIRKQTYLFTFEMRDGRIVVGSGRWVGRSVADHVDFAWYPFVARPENPEIHYPTVLKLLGRPAPEHQLAMNPPSATPQTPDAEGDEEHVDRSGEVENNVAAEAEGEPNPPSEPVEPIRPQPVPSAVAPPEPISAEPAPSAVAVEETVPAEPAAAEIAAERRQAMEDDDPLMAEDAPAAPPFPSPEHGTDRPAQTVALSPMELVGLIMDRTSSFELDVTVDRFDGGHYRPGETVGVLGGSGQGGYLSLLLIDSEGRLSLLQPQGGLVLPVQQNEPFAFQGFVLPENAPSGAYRIKAVVTRRPLLFSGMVSDGVQQQRLRLPPKQEQQVRRLLQTYQQGQQRPLTQLQLGTQSSRALIGPFAQDEVAFYVDARPSGPPPQPKPGQHKRETKQPSQSGPEKPQTAKVLQR